MTADDLKPGLELFVLNGKKQTIYKDYIEWVKEQPEEFKWFEVKLKKFTYAMSSHSLLEKINPVIEQHNWGRTCQGILFRFQSTEYYVFTDAIKAQEHLINYVLPENMIKLQVKADNFIKGYNQVIEQVGINEKELADAKEKLKNMQLTVTQK